jgi:hypothetical protein
LTVERIGRSAVLGNLIHFASNNLTDIAIYACDELRIIDGNLLLIRPGSKKTWGFHCFRKAGWPCVEGTIMKTRGQTAVLQENIRLSFFLE